MPYFLDQKSKTIKEPEIIEDDALLLGKLTDLCSLDMLILTFATLLFRFG